MEKKEFKFNEQTVNFEIDNKNVMVNATEMANVFGKKCIEFIDLKNTQELVRKLVEKENLNPENKKKDDSQSGNSHFENPKNLNSQTQNSGFGNESKKENSPCINEEMLIFEDEFTPNGKFVKVIRGGNNPGTWMDRRIAIAFAMWLEVEFYLWVCETIDELLFGSYKEDEESYKEIARIQTKITDKENELKNNPVLKEIEDLKKAEQLEKRKIELRKKMKISQFRMLFSESEMEGKGEK